MFNIWDGYTDDNLADTPSAASDRGNRLPLDVMSKIGASLWDGGARLLKYNIRSESNENAAAAHEASCRATGGFNANGLGGTIRSN
jgi:hypothetical protein